MSDAQVVVVQRRVFSWDEVSERVCRELLQAAEAGQDIEPRAAMMGEELRARLTQIYGRPPSMKSLDRWNGWQPIYDWALRDATAEQLDSLIITVKRSLSGPDRTIAVRTMTERRAFISRRHLTLTFYKNLHRCFVTAHKTSRPVQAKGRVGGRAQASQLRVLAGADGPVPPLYDYQRDAVDRLGKLANARAARRRRGLVILPTGGGKTRVAVTWALDKLASDPSTRVLWIAHQEELLLQAARTFETLASSRPHEFRRRLRVISSQQSAVSTLADPHLDVAITTWQSLYANWRRASRLLRKYASRPTVVVVDEAHHAGSTAYEKILTHLEGLPRIVIVGLTATPWPSSSLAAARLRRRFPTVVAQVSTDQLHARGILAVPVLHTVNTHERLELTGAEQKIAKRDLPPAVLQRLQTDARDSLLVRTWRSRHTEWGKSLIFATSTAHADELGTRFEQAGAPVRVLHSRVGVDRAATLEWFEKGPEQGAVLVSVGMLTEGVDLPSARTAFLARPTTSRILLRQMIGRVLRGPSAGGEPTAHVVYLRDVWANFDDVLEPGELPDIDTIPGEDGADDGDRLLPPVRAVDGQEVPRSIIAQLERAYSRRVDRIPLDPAMSRTALCGYYVTEDGHVPVMEHQRDGFETLIRRAKTKTGFQGMPLVSLFDDDHPPYPADRQLQAVRSHVQNTGQAPPFIELVAEADPRAVARQLREQVLDEEQRESFLRKQYETTLARIAYRTLDHFEEAVERELRELRQTERASRNRLNAERPSAPPTPPSGRGTPLRRKHDRQLPTITSVINKTCDVLAGEEVIEPLRSKTYDPPALDWTRNDVDSTWAHWSLKTAGKAKGQVQIRINRRLQAPHTQVSDDLLEYLIFHELLHDLLPRRGHDAEFRRLEAMWPDADNLDFVIDTLHEQFSLPRAHH